MAPPIPTPGPMGRAARHAQVRYYIWSLWMLNPSRRIPPEMPDYLRKAIGNLDLTDPVIWASLTHHGQ